MAKKIQIDLQVKDKGSKEVKKFAKTTDKSFKNIEKSAKKMNDSFSKITRTLKLMAAAAAILVAVKLVSFMKEAVTAASDLEEAMGKFSVVFAGQEEIAMAWANTLVDAYAMSRREAAEYLSSVQDLLVPMGMAADAAGDMSFEVVKLSADLGSFNNLPTARVMGDIQSALVGNYETMKKYGVVLNATVVQEKAMSMGLVKTRDALTAAHKAQAAYMLIVAGSQAAIGDMGRTYDNYANVLKRYNRTMENLKATIGSALLEPLTKAVEKLNEWIKANEEAIGQNFEYIINTLTEAIKDLNVSMTSLSNAAKSVGKFFNKWGDALSFVAGILAMKAFQSSLLFLGKVLAFILTKIHPIVLALVLFAGISDELRNSLKGLLEVIKGNLDWSDYLHSNVEELEELLKKIDELNEKQIVRLPMPAMLEPTGNGMKKYMDAQLAAEEDMLKERIKLIKDGVDAEKKSELELIKQLEALFIRKSELLGENQKAELAAEHYRYKYFVEANGKILGAAEVHAMELQAIRKKYAMQGVQVIAEGLKAEEAARIESINIQLENDAIIRKAHEDNLRRMSERWQAANAHWTSIGNSFVDNITDAFGNMASGAKDIWKTMAQSLLSDITRVIVKMMILRTLTQSFGGYSGFVGNLVGSITGKAAGGPVNKTTPYLVGERGPELFIPNQSGNITPNDKLESSQSQSQPVLYNININAVDADSFEKLSRRNPEAIITPIIEALQKGHQPLRGALAIAR